MRLLEIELQNFRSYEHETIQFTDGRTLLIGENGTGKSTLIDAIAWGLTGRCRGVDGRGQGQKELIRLGADQATVRVKTDSLTVTRQISRNGGATASVKTESVLAALGVSEAMLLAVLYGRHFFTLHHAEAKAMLMQLLDVTIPLDKLPPAVAKGYSGPLTLDDAQAAYDAAFKDRAATKKALAAITVPDVPARPDLDGLATVPLQQAIQEARKAYQAAVADLASAESRRDTAAQVLAKAKQQAGNLDRLKGSLEAHQGMLAEAQAALDQARTALAAVEATPAEPVDQLQAEARAKAAAVGSVDRQVAGTGTVTDEDKATTARLCVLGQGIPCLTPAKEFKAVVKQLKADVKALEVRITDGLKRGTDLAAANTQARTCERQLAYHQDQVAKLQAQVDEAKALADQIDHLASQAQQAADMVAPFREPVQRHLADQDRLVKQQTDLAGYTAQLKGRDRALADRQKLEQQLAVAEALVDLLGPKGLPAKVLAQAIGDFQGMINAALQPFGFQLSIIVDPWHVAVRTADKGQPIPFDLLSAGEQLWTGLAFQLALAALSGLNCCCLDATETVVGRRRAILTGLVMGAPVDQVIVGMAKAADEAAPEIQGLQVIRRQAAA